jgi:hypothetical protein
VVIQRGGEEGDENSGATSTSDKMRRSRDPINQTVVVEPIVHLEKGSS